MRLKRVMQGEEKRARLKKKRRRDEKRRAENEVRLMKMFKKKKVEHDLK